MKLQGRKILITGASQGFGLAVAERCIAEGADVAVCARSREQIEHAASALRAQAGSGQRVTAAVSDGSEPQEMEGLVAASPPQVGRVDGLVYNTGGVGPH